MSAPTLVRTVLAEGPADGEVFVVGPSLGTSVEALWGPCARLLGERYRVVGWDLPGHGRSPSHDTVFTVAELAETLLGEWPEGRVRYAGVSVGGATGLELALLDGAASDVTILCSGAAIGTRESWQQRAELVRDKGTEAVVDGSIQRWFAPGSMDREPETCAALLKSLRDSDSASYARVCGALGEYDVRSRLGEITVPVLAVAGESDSVCPPALAQEIADGVHSGRSAVVGGAGHLAPAEQPRRVADLLLGNDSTADQRNQGERE